MNDFGSRTDAAFERYDAMVMDLGLWRMDWASDEDDDGAGYTPGFGLPAGLDWALGMDLRQALQYDRAPSEFGLCLVSVLFFSFRAVRTIGALILYNF